MNKHLVILIISLGLLLACEEDDTIRGGFYNFENEVFDLVNAHRKSIGKTELVLHTYILTVAREHSDNMASGSVAFGHDGFSERVADIRSEIDGGGTAAENVAYGYSTAEAVVNGWLNSDGHRQNIEGDYIYSAVGIAQSETGTYYYTQIFLNN